MAGETSNGVTLYWGTTSGTSLGRLTSVGGPESECAEIDCTTMDDTAATYLPGIPSAGTISFEGNYTPAVYNTLHTALMAKTTSSIALVYAGGSDFLSAGFLSRLAPGAELNGAIKSSGTIRLSGALTHSAS